jgi:hypothetical protein
VGRLGKGGGGPVTLFMLAQLYFSSSLMIYLQFCNVIIAAEFVEGKDGTFFMEVIC